MGGGCEVGRHLKLTPSSQLDFSHVAPMSRIRWGRDVYHRQWATQFASEIVIKGDKVRDSEIEIMTKKSFNGLGRRQLRSVSFGEGFSQSWLQ